MNSKKIILNKKLVTTLITLIFLVSLTLTATPVTAGEFHTVRGDVYIDDVLASEGIKVKIEFETGEEEDLTSATGHYQIDFQGYDYETGEFYVYYSGKWNEPTDNKTIDIDPEQYTYVFDLHITSPPSPPPTPPPPSPPPSPPPADTNNQPVADASAGEPYQGFVGEEITFDGSGSTDSDGTITNYTWNFGDNTTGYGVNPTHTYDTSREYTIFLTVTDNEGATDTDETTVNILVPNMPPEEPTVVNGTQEGKINTTYEFTAVSTDADNDTIQYIFDWGDGQTNETEFVPNGTQVTLTHTWSAPGNYTVKITAFDNDTFSEIAEYLVSIEEEKEPTPEEEYDYTWLILLLILIIILLILLWLIKRKKPEEKKQPPKKTGNTSKKPSKKTGKK